MHSPEMFVQHIPLEFLALARIAFQSDKRRRDHNSGFELHNPYTMFSFAGDHIPASASIRSLENSMKSL
jgi:hypothetical protein